MDPEACIQRIENAIRNAEIGETIAAVGDYYQWRLKGGFQPAAGDPWLIRQDVARAVVFNLWLNVMWSRKDVATLFLPSAVQAYPVILPRWETFAP